MAKREKQDGLSRRLFSGTISLRLLMSILLVGVVILQSVLFVSVICRSGMFSSARQGVYEHFSVSVQSAGADIGSRMVQEWGNTADVASLAESKINDMLAAEKLDSSDLRTGSAASKKALYAAYDVVLSAASAHNQGAFLIMSDGGATSDANSLKTGKMTRDAFYLRDSNVSSKSINNSDLLIAASPVDMAKKGDIALDSDWHTQYTLPEDEGDREYFTEILNVSDQCQTLSTSSLLKWSVCSKNSGSARAALICTAPLRDKEGRTYAVLGTEMQLGSISSYLTAENLDPNGKQGATLALVKGVAGGQDQEVTYDVVSSSGASASLYIKDAQLTLKTGGSYETVAPVANAASGNAAADKAVLKLYEDHSPYEGTEWSVIGLEPESMLFVDVDSWNRNIMLSVLIALLVSAAVIAVAVRFTTSRIGLVARTAREAQAGSPLHFEQTGIREFDELTNHLERYSKESTRSLGRLSRVLRMTGQSTAAFERAADSHSAIFTEKYFEMLHLELFSELPSKIAEHAKSGVLGFDELEQLDEVLKPFVCNIELSGTHANVLVKMPNGKWVRQMVAFGEDGLPECGCLLDVTNEMEIRRQLEQERDHDILTGLLNRRAFEEAIQLKLGNLKEGELAAVAMLDLDNLKSVNDSFGHGVGDRYIKTAAMSLQKYTGPKDLLARISGDEFMVYLASLGSEEEAVRRLEKMQEDMGDQPFKIRGGFQRTVTCSAGVAFAPADGSSLDELKTRADAAMYSAKNAGKNKVCRYGE